MFCPPAPPPSLPRALAPAVANLFDETALEEIGALPPAFSLEYLPSRVFKQWLVCQVLATQLPVRC